MERESDYEYEEETLSDSSMRDINNRGSPIKEEKSSGRIPLA